MIRKEFAKVIKIMSVWKVDKRKGDYKLPNGERLSDYLERTTSSFFEEQPFSNFN